MKAAERVVGILLIGAAAVTAFYWWSYFTGGDVRVIAARWYVAFESSFPIADGWMAFCAAVAGIGFVLDRDWAARFGLMAAASIFYLAAMDSTFDIENGLYALAATNDAMRFEIFINASCLLLGMATLIVSWARLDSLRKPAAA
jgi:hypothetical protein